LEGYGLDVRHFLYKKRKEIMREVILDQIAFEPNIEKLMQYLHVRPHSEDAQVLQRLTSEARDIARPRGLYKIAFIESAGDDFVVVDGVKLVSRVLRVNLDQLQRVFPHIATCGMELEEWSKKIDDILERFWADAIKEAALRTAAKAITDDIERRYQVGPTARMSPGSLKDWPITEQRGLFKILGNPKEAIGVELLDSCLMIPIKSVSRLLFATEQSFENCQLCPREDCPNRRAPYDKTLYERKYRLSES
jgi:hypothetical protein